MRGELKESVCGSSIDELNPDNKIQDVIPNKESGEMDRKKGTRNVLINTI